MSHVLSYLRSFKVSGLVTIVLLLVFLVSGETAMSSTRSLTRLQTLIDQNRQQVQSLQQSIQTLGNQNAATIRHSSSALPNTLDIPAVLDEANTIAAVAHVRLISFHFVPTNANAPAGTSSEPNVKPYRIDVVVAGTRDQILDFLDSLEAYPRFTTVQSVGFQSALSMHEPSASLEANITFDIYTDP